MFTLGADISVDFGKREVFLMGRQAFTGGCEKDFPAEGQHEQTASCDRLQVNKSVRSFFLLPCLVLLTTRITSFDWCKGAATRIKPGIYCLNV